MAGMELEDFNKSIEVIEEIERIKISAGYRSYEVFAWENSLSRIQYWKMEQGTNCTLKVCTKF